MSDKTYRLAILVLTLVGVIIAALPYLI